MHTQKTVKISEIYLDNDNPRHVAIDNEPDIIKHLVAKENIKALAKSIVALGSTSPLERVALFSHPKVKGAYCSAEGNRRICALKLLADPSKAPNESTRKTFESLAKKLSSPLLTIDAVIFDDPETARPWISLRHEGPQDGAGTKPWNPVQKARWNAKGEGPNNPNIQASLLVDYAVKHGLVDEADRSGISVTTLTRYLSSPVFRHTVGLVDNKSLRVNVPKEEFDRVAERFLLDSVTPDSGVNSRTSAHQRKEYASKLRTEGVAPHGRMAEVDLLIAPVTTKTSTKRDSGSPKRRPRVIPSSFAAHIANPVLKRMYDELKGIDPDEFTFAATYLLRAVIEMSASLRLKKAGIAQPKELHQKLEKLADLLEKEGKTDREVKVLRTMANNKHSPFSPDTIGHFVHGGAVPTKTDLYACWDSVQELMSTIFIAK